MNTRHSTVTTAIATTTNGYQPTIIESGLLVRRLASEIEFFRHEVSRGWVDFKRDPAHFGSRAGHDLLDRLRKALSTPNVIPASLTAVVTIAAVVMIALLVDRARDRTVNVSEEGNGTTSDFVMLDVASLRASDRDKGMGRDGKGRVGFQKDKGEGSGATSRSQGGGSGGDSEPMPPQVGEPPPPSPILASIPKAPPLTPPTLPAAGIDLDPALWKDLKAPVYGDPTSNSAVPSKGPGDGGGIGTNNGLGIGIGSGPGVGVGTDGNMGGGPKQTGCCGPGGGAASGSYAERENRTFTGREVEQRARLLSKPEPQYTEEARRNQISGTVMLRVVFSSTGEVVQIRAVHPLPYGLTERAIAAARQIKFIPAEKGGRPVSVYMQLEYNFNLY